MSKPQIILTASSESPSFNEQNNSHKLQQTSAATSKENIRKRLNMHVKKRIQGQNIIAHYPLTSTSTSSTTIYPNSALPSTIKTTTHSFLMSSKKCNENSFTLCFA